MRVASINEKRYVLVIVDDYSRYTWTHFLRSKDETPEVLIDFLRLVQIGLQAQVRVVRTDKGTKFLNHTLHAYFATEWILHQTSVPRTPEQNGVVERRNRTLVDAARTMLSAAKVPLFFWAEAIATACFTQTRSLVIPRHEKTPYHIINDRKPSIKFFHIFGSICYIVRDGENLDKMKEKGDECIFVWYSTLPRAYKVFKKRTRMIMESIHVNFDELPQIASDQLSSDPAPECQSMALNHDSLSPAIQRQANVPQADRTVTTSNGLDLLFSLMFDELLNGSSKVVSKSSAVSAADAPNQRQNHTTPLNNHTTPAPTCQIPTIAPTVISSENINQAETYAKNDQVADDEFINIFSMDKRSSTRARVILTTSVSRPQLRSNPLGDRVMRNNSQGKKQEVEDQRRNLDMCVLSSVAKPIKKIVASESNQKPRNITRKLYERVSKTCSWWYSKYTPLGYKWKPKFRQENINQNVVEIVLFIVDFGCSKHMTGNLKLLINFLEKFLGTVKFGNDQIAPILGYGDLVQGAITIKRVYYVEGLDHNLFFVGQFCDAELDVAFRKSTCFIHDLNGNDLITGSSGTNLYSITLQDTNSPNLICLMAKATSSQAWLWHRRLSHLNFNTINLLSNNDIVVGLPKLKFVKDHLCSSCELGKAKQKSFHTKLTPSLKRRKDGENLDKMKKKGDECIFVGYFTQSRAYRVFNKRTRVIMESIHVNFDQLPQIASDQISSDPAPECQTMVLNHDSLSPSNQRQANVPQADRTVTTSNELDLLFSLMFDELLNGFSKVVSKSSIVSAADAPNQRQQLRTPLNNHTTPAPTSQVPTLEPTVTLSENINQAETYVENDQVADDEFINIFSTLTKDHPLEQVIGNPSQSVRTRRQLESDAEMCMFTLTVSRTEPKNIKEAMADSAWIESMQEELYQFDRLDVWELVNRPLCTNVINLKWLWKNKRDEENTVI
nr:retrovirus-related Pol polyprotein from transposon TNT 1-94 [Tanacetum cinerariifolium]